MSSPRLSIPLGDYEGHMNSESVQQLAALSELFQHTLVRYRPESVAVLGVAGGNGLEHIDSAITKRVIGIDINQHYLDAVRQRFEALPGLELYCRDLGKDDLNLPQMDLTHAALIFEHAGLNHTLDNALSLVRSSGTFSVVLQLPSASEPSVAATNYTSLQKVKQHFTLINPEELREVLAQRGFQLVEQEHRPLPAGKAFWSGVFNKSW